MLAQTLVLKDGWVLLQPDFRRSKCVITKDTSNIVIIVFFPKEAHWAGFHFILSGKKILCRFFDTVEAKREDPCEERSLACMKKLAPWLKQVDHKLKDEGDFDIEAAVSFLRDVIGGEANGCRILSFTSISSAAGLSRGILFRAYGMTKSSRMPTAKVYVLCRRKQ